ncbi:hypothetical protein [Streptomyces noursei]|uniref:hypothetical protein n=1 Tax=Streptomyces noursei TaxID=1971 RepID=UPI00167B6E65|nr:hypothetical protein [Streptomyces noursei]MCZ1021176.1 hypothetical protein [Streptomyces noursei]GGX57503.1 hypothetical protein GCM10010341_91830 [Streptomyces noursei]
MRKAAIVAAGTLFAISLTAGVAHAEGSFTSYASGWVTGKESRHWKKNSSAGTTTVQFSGCSTSNAPGFRYAGVQFKKEISLRPDPILKRHNNYCNTSNFGQPGKGKYYFNYSNLNGNDAPRAYLNVKKITVKY